MHQPITIHAKTTVGAFRALETLMQLATRDHLTGHIVIENVPLKIHDEPAYRYRGYMLDTSRHFMQPMTIKRQLEAMAMNKMNVFHWHISDAQSFPLASKATHLGEGAFSSREVYTKDDVLDIVRFARDRGIMVIPEFDMPGHAAAWGGGYPNLTVCNGWKHDPPNGLDFKFNTRQYSGQSPAGQLDISKPETLDLVEALLTEMAEWFPGSKYFHLGHDEINENCYQSAGLDTMDLLRKFQLHLEKVTAKLGLKKVLWQEPITDPRFRGQINVSQDTLVQAWGTTSIRFLCALHFHCLVGCNKGVLQASCSTGATSATWWCSKGSSASIRRRRSRTSTAASAARVPIAMRTRTTRTRIAARRIAAGRRGVGYTSSIRWSTSHQRRRRGCLARRRCSGLSE